MVIIGFFWKFAKETGSWHKSGEGKSSGAGTQETSAGEEDPINRWWP